MPVYPKFPPCHKVHTDRMFDYILYGIREKSMRLMENMVRSHLTLGAHAQARLILPCRRRFHQRSSQKGDARSLCQLLCWPAELPMRATGIH
ncbi:hypothetical protein F4778DRAFT_720814 [Xylariomycetidae sp. FL2044]|nr:hypothetical protein F4778DRAFT_720814 [Xylariomycetidae sp. FL2044]